MKSAWNFSPAQLAASALGGSMLAYASAWMTVLPLPYPIGHPHGFLPLLWASRYILLLTLAPLLVGGALSLCSLRLFEKNIRNDRWTQEQLDALRTQLSRSLWTWLTSVPSFAGLGFVFAYLLIRVSGHHHSSPGAFAYFFVVPLLCLQWLRTALQPPRHANAREWLNQRLQPLTSSHWGESPRSGTFQ